MWLSVQQVLADPNRALEIPKATFDTATMDLEPLLLHLVTELSHPQDQTKLETQLQKLQAQVIPSLPPHTGLGAQSPVLTLGPIPGSVKPLPQGL